METHIQFDKVKNFWHKVGYQPVHVVEAQGHSGGLWALASLGLNLNIVVWEYSHHSITLEVTMGNRKWLGTAVYASPNATTRDKFWHYLCNLSKSISSPWLLIGDWNEILLPGEQKGCIFSPSRTATFWDVLDQCGLMDLDSTGGKFTWHRTQGYKLMAKRLDRGLANLQWRLNFQDAFIEVLCRMHSDHNPLLLRLGGIPQNRGPKPFRFEAAWIMHNDYQGVVQAAWNRRKGKPLEALHLVKEDFIAFNKDVFGSIFKRKRNIESRIKGIQRALERVDSLSLHHLEQSLQHEYNHILFQEELLWFQKSRENRVKLGYRNTAYFHAQTVIRRRRNRIQGISLPNGI